MKLLIIFTGGTIGSTEEDGIIDASGRNEDVLRLFRESPEGMKYRLDIDTVHPYTVLSENLTGRHIRILDSTISEHKEKGYDGIIITHGTDSISYMAAAIDMLFAGADIPIVFVSSDLVLTDPAANGLSNFAAAVDFIDLHMRTGDPDMCGTFAAFRNSDGVTYIHRGSRLLRQAAYTADLMSAEDRFFARQSPGGGFDLKEDHVDRSPGKLLAPAGDASSILMIEPYPGMRFPELIGMSIIGRSSGQQDRRLRAVILNTYHSGTFYTDTPEFAEFLKQAEAIGTPIFVSGSGKGKKYLSELSLDNENIYILPKASPVAMYIKLWLAYEYALSREEISGAGRAGAGEIYDTICRNVAGEIIP